MAAKKKSKRSRATSIVPRVVFQTMVAVSVVPVMGSVAGCNQGIGPATDSGFFSVVAAFDAGRDAGPGAPDANFGVDDVGFGVADGGFSVVAIPHDAGHDAGRDTGFFSVVAIPDDGGFSVLVAPFDSGSRAS